MIKKIDYRRFIESEFFIVNKDDEVVPFKLNGVQSKYYDLLTGRYPGLQGTREIVLKARQQGMSSFILALFAVDFVCRPHSKSLCISHNDQSTKMLFRKVKFYVQGFCEKNGINSKEYLSIANREEMVNKSNGAEFAILTAGAKVGGRGWNARNVLFSETAFYPDVEKITAEEMIHATTQMVPVDQGMIFLESTANGYGNYFQRGWAQAEKDLAEAKEKNNYDGVYWWPSFFGWNEFYTKEFIEKKKREFVDPKMFFQEYPLTPEEAFISTGTPFFDLDALKDYERSIVKHPIKTGNLATDGEFM